MPATASTRSAALTSTMRTLGECLGAALVFLRRHDHERGLSLLEARWPRRNLVAPWLEAEVAFDANPLFEALRDLTQPVIVDDHALAVEMAGTAPIAAAIRGSGAVFPILRREVTSGALGILFSRRDRSLGERELAVLQATANLIAQFGARVRAESLTAHLAMHDELTGMPNRRALIQLLDDRLKEGLPTTLLLADLDRFKVMNDFLGHLAGDKVLVVIADRIKSGIGAGDFAARLGSDEFVVVPGEASNEHEALTIAYRLLESIARPINVRGQQITHTASIGIAASAGEASVSDLLGWADIALHGAKAAGKNRALVLDETLRDSVDERSSTELTLRGAIKQNGLRMHYQPEVDMRTGELLALEALVRWRHASRGLLQAAEFIQVAEETGLVVELGRWVLNETCAQVSKWMRDYPDLPVVVRFNMSPAQFLSRGIVEFVDECLSTNGVPGERLCVEITERAALHDDDQTIRILEGLRDLGLSIALDDFGTGYASMTDLKRLPVTALKLDQGFVQNVATDHSDQAIVEAIIRLAKALGLDLVAEGIESPDTVHKLLELGCVRGQGYLFSMPLAAEDLATVLASGRLDLAYLHPPEHDLTSAATDR